MLGFTLGRNVPSAQDHLAIIEAVIIVASLVPLGVHYLRSRRGHRTHLRGVDSPVASGE
jgi:hypothetical protein